MLIAAADLLPALQSRATIAGGDVLTFNDTDALRALETVSARRPTLVALERQFAATPRGAALINRIKADPSLAHTEIRVLAHDSDYSRVVPRATSLAGSTPPVQAAAPVGKPAAPTGTPAAAAAAADANTTAATMEAPPLDQGTRRAPRFRIADKVDVLIDGNPAALVELSTCGAQVLSPTVLKPNQRVRMVLADEGSTLRLTASIAWAAFEIPTGGPQYRAGIEFIAPDAAALDSFCQRHVS